MSRGGFGGARSSGGMMHGHKLPFDVDPDLEKEVMGYDADGNKTEQEDPRQALFPPYPGGVPRAPPVTDRERKLVNMYREMIAQKHAGPFYTGPKGSLKSLCGTKRSAAEFNPFEDQPTYGKKYERKEFRLPDIRKHKFAAPHLFPKELWATIGYNPNAEGGEVAGGVKKKLMLSKKTNLDKLARFDEDAEQGAAAGGDDDESAENRNEEDADEPEGPRDDDFDEDEDDDGDDYNAEQYFDGGEDDYEDAGGDEYAGDDGELNYCPYKKDWRPTNSEYLNHGSAYCDEERAAELNDYDNWGPGRYKTARTRHYKQDNWKYRFDKRRR